MAPPKHALCQLAITCAPHQLHSGLARGAGNKDSIHPIEGGLVALACPFVDSQNGCYYQYTSTHVLRDI
uniref:Putative secreted protein n=1 Tax=Anopheles darlingi TaxID=43151 RepID=A0A2M4DLA8_ANODA